MTEATVHAGNIRTVDAMALGQGALETTPGQEAA
jgi:hypothetical protein